MAEGWNDPPNDASEVQKEVRSSELQAASSDGDRGSDNFAISGATGLAGADTNRLRFVSCIPVWV